MLIEINVRSRTRRHTGPQCIHIAILQSIGAVAGSSLLASNASRAAPNVKCIIIIAMTRFREHSAPLLPCAHILITILTERLPYAHACFRPTGAHMHTIHPAAYYVLIFTIVYSSVLYNFRPPQPKNRPHALTAEHTRLMPKTCSLHMCVRVCVCERARCERQDGLSKHSTHRQSGAPQNRIWKITTRPGGSNMTLGRQRSRYCGGYFYYNSHRLLNQLPVAARQCVREHVSNYLLNYTWCSPGQLFWWT